jgi:parvulin-like peptidyl-prolyl isomerase
MDEVAMEASDQLDRIDAVADLEVIRKNRLAQLVRSVDEFFIKQTAEWRAAEVVADRFNKSFADGWSKLNKLSGEYITGDKLAAYLDAASVKLTAIVAERDAAADQKIASLNAYRAQMQESA